MYPGLSIESFLVIKPLPGRLLKFADLSQIQGKIKRKSGVYTCK